VLKRLAILSAAIWGALALSAACGRTEPYRYTFDQARMDAGVDAGLPDASLDAAVVDAGFVPCDAGRFTLAKASPVVMLVIDRSGSMSESFSSGSGSVTKWKALTDSLEKALPAVSGQMQIGALIYPGGVSTGMTCSAPTVPDHEPRLNNVSAIIKDMRENLPAGGTPTAVAIENAGADLRRRRAAGSARAMIIATDGAPGCNGNLDPFTCTCLAQALVCLDCLDDVRTIGRVRDEAAAGIPSYVIGIQSSTDQTFTNVLNGMAIAGGRAQSGTNKFFSATSSSELEQALVAIRNQLGQCTFLTTSVPDLRGSISISLDNTTIPEDATNGWKWSDKSNGEMVLSGSSCTNVANRMNAVLFADVKCGGNDP
jgi:hypothetical protein